MFRTLNLLALSFCGAFLLNGADTPTKPNLLFILVDNVGYGDLGCYGNDFNLTPRIDELAKEGVLCRDFYIGSPSCMPSRGALLTGRHPVRNGLNEQIYLIDEHEQIGLPQDETILPQYLKEANYVSGCFGKWNLGFAPGSRPTDRGFKEYFGCISGNCDYETYVYNGRNDLYRNTEPATSREYSSFAFADAAIDFIERHQDQPFFCYLPLTAAHFPNPKNKEPAQPAIWQAPEKYLKLYGATTETLDERIRYAAVLSAMDAAIGRVLDTLGSLGIADNTLVAFLSDNGAFMIPGRGLECGSNGPLKGGGTLMWEGGIRVPAIFRWPGKLPAGKMTTAPLSSLDLVPLALQLAGLPLPTEVRLDGIDPLPALLGQSSSADRTLYFHYGNGSALRSGHYKLLRERPNRPWQLFDLERDIGETWNLSDTMTDVAADLAHNFQSWFQEAQRKQTPSP